MCGPDKGIHLFSLNTTGFIARVGRGVVGGESCDSRIYYYRGRAVAGYGGEKGL